MIEVRESEGAEVASIALELLELVWQLFTAIGFDHKALIAFGFFFGFLVILVIMVGHIGYAPSLSVYYPHLLLGQ